MTDELNDELAAMRAQIDQGSAGIEDFARGVVRIHKILREGGLPDAAAVNMAMSYWQLILNGIHQATVAKAAE